MTEFKHAIKGMMLALFGFSLFSFGDTFMKFMADSGFAPYQTAFWISLMAMIGYLSIAPEIGGLKQTFKTKKLPLHILRGLLSVCVFFMVINGFQKLGLAMTYTLIFIGPFFATILSALILKDKVGKHRWTSIVLGFVGVLVVLRPGSAPIELAAIGMIFAAFCYACGSIIIRKIGNDEPIIAFAIYNTLISLIVFGVICLFNDGFERIPTISELTYFIAVVFFHIGGTFAVTRAFRETETALVAPFHYVQLLWGIIFGYIFFETSIDLWTGIGAGIIVSGGIYMIWREKVRNAELNRGATAHGTID
jgi:S-adenosylmethionine uptake transporter